MRHLGYILSRCVAGDDDDDVDGDADDHDDGGVDKIGPLVAAQ